MYKKVISSFFKHRSAPINLPPGLSAIKHSDERLLILSTVFENSPEAIMITDASGCIVSVNPAFKKTTGYSFAEVSGKNPSLLSTGRHDRHFYSEKWRDLAHQGYWQGETWNRRKNGEEFPQWETITMVRNSTGEVSYYAAFFSDISEIKATQQKIEFLSYHDVLTGLPNRLLAKRIVNEAIRSSQDTHSKFAVLVVGMDNFKAINNTLGNPTGDRMLAEVACRLYGSVNDTCMVNRGAGDKFIVFLKDTGESDQILQVSMRIFDSMASPFVIDNQEISTSVSIGIAVFPHDGDTFDTLLKNANSAIRLAKNAGCSTYRFFDESLNINASEYWFLRNGLRRALEKNTFVLHYQPQFNLRTGKLIGAEALVRWHEPEFGLIQPTRFIPVAEESALIVEIGEWVMQEACREAMKWQQAGLPKFIVAVNLSSVQFKRRGLVEAVKKALEKSGLEPGCLELELTESILLSDTETTLAAVQQLKSLGVKLSIDDFGTGYSSLSYLKRFNVDRIKIDQSFVRDMAIDTEDTAIVQAIIQIAKSLSFKTVAEGIESQGVAEKLLALGCDEGQGYFFARPMPTREFSVYLENYKQQECITP